MRILQVVLLVCFSQITVAQSFNGYLHSDFSGVIGAQLQPANLAGSPYKYDFSLINGNFFLTNNIAYNTKTETGGGLFRFLEREPKFLHSNIALGGFSGMISLAGDESLGLTYRIRAHASVIDLSPDFIIQFGRFTNPRFDNTVVTNQQGDFATSLWRELALTYAKVLKDDGYNRSKFGATLKQISPRASAFLRINDFDYESSAGTTTINNADMSFGYSSNLNEFEQFDGDMALNKLPASTGSHIAFDLGFVFERIAFRADPKDENGTMRKPDIDYEFKISASITDLGKMTFETGSASATALVNVPTANIDNIDLLFEGLSSVRNFRDSLATFAQVDDLNITYTVSLPTSLNLGYDYNFGNDFYAGAAARIDLTSFLKTDFRLNYLHSITLSPRWEQQKKGIYMPLYFNQLGDFHWGLAARYGAITLGTQSINSLLTKENGSAGFFFSINLNQLKANSKKPYCFGTSRGTAMTNTERTPIYKRKKWIFF
uniref:DUF5723 family protein n=1 Tax=Roseivirga sp. TaxID=1964215 RepID=UPI0040470A73